MGSPLHKIRLSVCLADNPRTRPLREGHVTADGVECVISTLHPSEMFWRQLHFGEFDVSEMSMSSLLISIVNGDRRWVAIPVFTSRHFFHNWILIRTDRGIEKPEDLRGKRVAVPEYQQTAAVWSRGVLEHDFGVHPSDIEWYMERTEDRSHGGATGFRPPEGLKFHRIPEAENIGSMLLAGAIDASLLYLNTANLVDRSTVDLRSRPEIRTLFDPVSEGARYYRQTGFYPMNHCVVLRRDMVDENPWIVLNLFKAFVEARDLSHRQAEELTTDYFELGLLPAEYRHTLETDLYPYGVQANRDAMETLTRFSYEQGLTPRKLALEEIFHPATLEM